MAAALPLLAVGLTDWATWGRPFFSWYQQLTRGAKISEFYGVSPWWNGFEQIHEAAGPWLLLLAVVSVVILTKTLWSHPAKEEARVGAFLVLPSVVFWAVHFCLGHKEARFFIPPIALIPVWFAVACGIGSKLTAREDPILNRAQEFLNPILLVPLSILCTAGVMVSLLEAHFPLEQVNTIWLERKIANMPSVRTDSCILEIGHDWSWSRGYMVTGKRVEWRPKELKNLTDSELDACPVALVFEGQLNSFATRSAWDPVAKIGSYTLFKNPKSN